MKNFKTIALGLLLAFTLTACAPAVEAPTTPGTTNPPANTQNPSTGLVDREGKTIKPLEKCDTIISMAPSITETLVNLGLGDKIIAVDTYSAKIPGLKADIPVFDMMAPDTESIAVLKPDIIFATGMSRADGDDPFKPVTDLGVFMTYIPSSTSIQGIKDDIKFIGEITNTADKASEIITGFENDIKSITDKLPKTDKKIKVYFEIGSSPKLYSFGTGTFLNEMIEMLGCENILAGQNGWLALSEEAILQGNPDVIFTNVDYIDDPVADIMNRAAWSPINAIKDSKVYMVHKDASSRANEFVIKAFEEMAKALYPESFK